MQRTLVIAAVILATLIRIETPFGADAGLTIPITAQGLPAFITLGLDHTVGSMHVEQFGDSIIYTTSRYRITITTTKAAIRDIVRVRVRMNSGEQFQLSHIGMRIRVPRNVIQGIWYPSSNVSSNNVMSTDARQSFYGIADANFGIPYIGAASATSNNILAFGLGRQDLSVGVEGEPVESGAYDVRLRIATPRSNTLFDERFYVSNDINQTWFEAASNYADWVDGLNGYRPFPVTDSALEPVYDTWYWSGDRVNETMYLNNARLASEIGAGLFLADAGWDTPDGEYDKWLHGQTGDYDPAPSKFPDIAKTFEGIRADSALGIQLWLQPFAVGRASRRYPETADLHILLPAQTHLLPGWNGLLYPPFALPYGQLLETVHLCPRSSGTESYFRNLFAEMAAKYNPEGFWLDFMDGVPTNCVASHTHHYQTFGEGFRQSLEAIKSTILAANPNAVVHFRAQYANLNTKQFANVWQSEDSPGDFDRMRLNALRLRPFSKGVVFASDQLYWPNHTDETTVSKFIITSIMTGVPGFGPNLEMMPDGTRTMLKNWLTFYRENKYDLALGRLSPFGQMWMPNHKIEGDGRTFVYVRNLDFNELFAAGNTIFIFNVSDSDAFSGRIRGPAGVTTYSVSLLDRSLNQQPGAMVVTTRGGVLYLDIAVEQGGVILLNALDGDSEGDSVVDPAVEPRILRPPSGLGTPTPASPRVKLRTIG